MKGTCIAIDVSKDKSEVNADLFDYIELFYNRRLIHSTLHYQMPICYSL
jgi:hypothetical protein